MEHKQLDAGQIVSTHGVDGEVKILPWADSPEFLLSFRTVYLGGKPYRVVRSRVQGTCVLMKLEGVDTMDSAMALRRQVVRVNRAEAKLEEGAVFVADLIGCRCLDDEDREIGTIRQVLNQPSSDVYVIEGEHSYLIPAVKEFVREINVSEGYVRLHLIEGFQTDEN